MKKLLFTLAALLFAAAFQGQAQERIQISRGALYANGQKIESEAAIRAIIGDDIYDETYASALRQRKIGKGLTIAGGITSGIGTVIALYGFAQSQAPPLETTRTVNGKTITEVQPGSGMASAVFLLGTIVTLAGSGMLDVGIPLLVIGNSRLRWVEENHNRQQPVTLSFSSSQYGLGLALRF